MLAGLTGMHLLVVALIVVVLFGATKLPIFAKGLGQSIKILRTELGTTPPAHVTDPVPATSDAK